MHDHIHKTDETGNIKIAFFLNMGFTLLELVGGVLTNSMAIISDAIHDLGDSLSLGSSLFLSKKARQGPDSVYSFGYKRYSLLGALINGFVLIIGSIIVLREAIPRLVNPQAVNAEGMLYLSFVGIAVNGYAVWHLKKGKTLQEEVLTWHMMEDVLGWVAVLAVSLAIMIGQWEILDPILSVGISIFVLWNAMKVLKKTIMVFMQAIPPSINIEEVKNILISNPHVISEHDTHVWTLDGDTNILTTHLVFIKGTGQEKVEEAMSDIRDTLEKYSIGHVTLEVEIDGQPRNCKPCTQA